VIFRVIPYSSGHQLLDITIATEEASPLTRLQIVWVIVALACGGFAIGTGEFAIMGLLLDVTRTFSVTTP
jgi:DHA1 family inner membrane transport protein